MNTVFRHGGKVVGEMENNVYKKTVSKSKHLMRVNQSWGIQNDILQKLSDDTRIEIIDKDESIVYSTTAKFFRDNCTYLQFQNHGLQAFLTLENFDKEKLNTWAE